MADRRLRCGPGVSWGVELHGMLVVDSARGTSRRLAYPEAAVWDFLSRGQDQKTVAAKVAAVAAVPLPEAVRLVERCLSTWCAEGLLVEEAGGG